MQKAIGNITIYPISRIFATYTVDRKSKDKEPISRKRCNAVSVARQVPRSEQNCAQYRAAHRNGTGRTADGGLNASWTLSWPEQREPDRANHCPTYSRRLPYRISRNDSSRLPLTYQATRSRGARSVFGPSRQRSSQFGHRADYRIVPW